jgi:hypothetical protein
MSRQPVFAEQPGSSGYEGGSAYEEYWRSGRPKWPWRNYLTDDERETIKRADEARAKWIELRYYGANATAPRGCNEPGQLVQISRWGLPLRNVNDPGTIPEFATFYPQGATGPSVHPYPPGPWPLLRSGVWEAGPELPQGQLYARPGYRSMNNREGPS